MKGKGNTGDEHLPNAVSFMKQRFDESYMQLKQNKGEGIGALLDELYSIAVKEYGDDTAIEAIVEFLLCIDDETKAFLHPIVVEYIIAKCPNIPIGEECRDDHIERRRFLNNLKYDCEYYRARDRINKYIEHHKGLKRLRRVYKRGFNGRLERTGGFAITENTSNEKILVPFLYGELQIAVNKIIKVEEYRQRINNYLRIWFDEWENARKDETVKSKQVASTPQQAAKMLPKELETEEAKQIFKRAIATKLMEETGRGYKWNGTKQLLAYFAERMSNKFELSNKVDKEGRITVSWKPFEELFGENNLRSAKNDWMKANTRFTPNGYEQIDSILGE